MRLDEVKVNFRSHDWHEIVAYLADELAKERQANDNKDADAVETAFRRGKISVYKQLISLEKAVLEATAKVAR